MQSFLPGRGVFRQVPRLSVRLPYHGHFRGYDSSGSSSCSPQSARRKGIKVATQPDQKKQGAKTAKKNKHKREKVTPEAPEAGSPKAASVPTAPAALLTSNRKSSPEARPAYAGTRFGLASPLPETLPMPTSFLLGPATASAMTANDATSALRSFLQIDASGTNKASFMPPAQSTAVLA